MTIDQFLAILRARYKIGLFALIVTVVTTTAITLILPKAYKADAKVVVDFKGGDPLAGSVVPMGAMMPTFMTTQVEIIKSRRVAMKVVDKLKVADNPKAQEQFQEATHGQGDIRAWLAQRFAKNLDVEPGRDSSVINITYTAHDSPQFAAMMANEFAQAAIDTNLEMKVEPARQASAWFDGQIKVLRTNLENAQSKLSAYQREKRITAVDERLDVENARLSELSSQLVVVQALAYEAQSKLKQTKEAADRSGELGTLPEVLANPLVQGLKADLSRQEAKLEELSSQLGKNHPQYKKLASEVDGLRQKIRDEVGMVTRGMDNSSRLAQTRARDIEGALAAQKTKVLELKKQRDDISVIVREVESAQRAFDGAMQRMAQVSLESRVNQTNLMLLESAVEPGEPASPKLVLNIFLSVILGTMLGVGLIMLLEIVDLRIRTEETLQRGLGLPVLGSVGRDTPEANGFWEKSVRAVSRLLGIDRSQVSFG